MWLHKILRMEYVVDSRGGVALFDDTNDVDNEVRSTNASQKEER